MVENKNKKEFNLKDEGSVRIAIDSCLDILGLISKSSFSKGTPYFFESLFIRLRHMAYYFSEKKIPLIQYNGKLSKDELSIIDKIVNIRIASAHPEADQHWLNEYIMISGGMNFKEEDVEIQYGSNKLFLIKEIIPIYKKLRMILLQTSELSHLAKHPYLKHQEQKFIKIEQELINLLKDPENFFKDKLSYN